MENALDIFDFGSSISGWGLAVSRVLDTHGINSVDVFNRAGINLKDSNLLNGRFPVVHMQNVWQYGSQNIEQDDFGYSVASNLNPASLNGLIPGLYASRNLLEMLNRFVRYRKVISSSFSVKLVDKGDSFLLVLNDERQVKTEAAAITTIFFLLKVCKDLYGPSFRPEQVFFQIPVTSHSTKFQELINAEICYNTTCSGILFCKESVLQPLIGIDLGLASQQDNIVEEYLRRIALQETMCGRVQLKTLELLAKGEVSLDNVAKKFFVSPRTLQRKLKLENSSYVHILNESRKNLALERAKKTECNVKELAYFLGFSDTATFSRAFKRWTSMTLTEYRQAVYVN